MDKRGLLQVAEPSTVLTDGLLTAQCLVYVMRLAGSPARRQWSATLWMLALGATGVAALAGAIHHALPETGGSPWRRGAWNVTGVATGFASGCMLGAGILTRVAPAWQAPLLLLVGLKWLIAAWYTWGRDSFRVLIADYLSAMLLLVGLQIPGYRRYPSSPWVVGGILVSIVAAVIQQSRVTLHRHFNHNDLFHVVQMGALHLFYRAARMSRDRTG